MPGIQARLARSNAAIPRLSHPRQCLKISRGSFAMVSSQLSLPGAYLKTPRAAAFAGIIFSVLWVAVFGLMRLSVPSDPFEEGAWLAEDTRYVAIAMNLVPFAGIAFLWFVGVLRDRLGAREVQFFATGFLGSGFLLLCRQ